MTVDAATTPPVPTDRPALAPGDSFVAHRARVYRWASAHGLDHNRCLDVVQETFSRLVKSPPALTSEAAQLGWLRRVALNLAVDAARARRDRTPRNGLRLVPADGPALNEEDRASLREGMSNLSEMQRLVLVMKTVDGLSFSEVAADLGIGTPTSKTHYLRALETIRRHVTGGEGRAGKGAHA
ncbi:MAG: sigma-70 family RNA polymerase sigma factor [Phycisphaerales bacterium]|nr:sigma-70 family RNA polymerase sigma factor [Phycisphaerales bacterium]